MHDRTANLPAGRQEVLSDEFFDFFFAENHEVLMHAIENKH